MLKVGITGGIGSGKSTVCKIFNLLNIPIYDSDARSRFLQENNSTIIESTISLFGKDAYFKDGKLNKTFVSKIVFENPLLLSQLNKIVHPIVIFDAQKWFQEQENKEYSYAIKESALLFSAGIHTSIDISIAVVSPLEVRVNRILKRDTSKTEQEIYAIIESQKANESFFSKTDFTVFNNENQLLIPQILAIDAQIKSKN